MIDDSPSFIATLSRLIIFAIFFAILTPFSFSPLPSLLY
jgi:hypothetical protein